MSCKIQENGFYILCAYRDSYCLISQKSFVFMDLARYMLIVICRDSIRKVA